MACENGKRQRRRLRVAKRKRDASRRSNEEARQYRAKKRAERRRDNDTPERRAIERLTNWQRSQLGRSGPVGSPAWRRTLKGFADDLARKDAADGP